MVAHAVVIRNSLKLSSQVLQMRIHRDVRFDSETSVFVGQLDPRCSEQDLVGEIGDLFRQDRNYRRELLKWEISEARRQGRRPPDGRPSDVEPHFILGCALHHNPKRGASKSFAFIDFNCSEAVDAVIKAWHEKSMRSFFSQLDVQRFSESPRQRRHAGGNAEIDGAAQPSTSRTTLFLQRLPEAMQELDVFDLCSLYGDVVSVTCKRPPVEVAGPGGGQNLTSVIRFRTEDQAATAISSLDGVALGPGQQPLRAEHFLKQARGPGLFTGLDKSELIQNKHFRVLYLKGIDLSVSQSPAMKVTHFGVFRSLKTR